MAIYGVSFYGSDLYGEAVVSLLSVEPFTAESRSYETASLSWTALGGNWSEFRLLRSGYGFAVNEYDGDIILSFNSPNFQSSFTDNGLAPNRFYYYTIFVFDLDTDQWVRAGQAQVLTLKDYGYYDLMIRHLPSFYTEMDDLRRPPGAAEGQLRRFLQIFALALDHIRGETESLGRIRSADDVSGGLLPFFSEDLGITYEPEIGMRQMRIWLRNAIYLYKIKGTRLGIEGVATAMTGWGADASAVGDDITIDFQANRINLITNPSFEVDTSGWTATASATMARVDGGWAAEGTSALRITRASEFPIVYTDVEVTEGRTYTLSLTARNVDFGSTVEAQILWYNDVDSMIDTSESDPFPISDTEDTRIWVTGTAPAGAVRAEARIVGSFGGVNGQAFDIDAALFEESSEVQDYFDGSLLGGDYIWEGTAHASPSHFYFNRAIKNARLDEVLEDYAPLGTTWAFTYAQP